MLFRSDVELSGASEEFYLRVKKIAYLAITPAAEGTNLVANLEDAEFSNNELKESIKAFKANVDAQKNLVLFSSVDIQRREAALHAAGKLVGSIDRILDAKADLDLILRSPLRELSDFEKGLSQTKGELLADAKVVGLLKNPAVQGRLEISNFVHDLWSMDKIELNGSYGAGFLVLDKIGRAHV